MRRRLVVVFAAVTTLVCVAFVLPLAALVRDVARERALDDATRDAAALFPVLAVTDDADTLAIAISRTQAGSDGRLGVFLADDTVVGDSTPRSDRFAAARDEGRAWTGDTADGAVVLAPVIRSDGETAVVQVFVPSGDLRSGVRTAWLTLALVGFALVAGSVLLADRLARSITRPVAALADASHRLGDGDLDARVEPEGPEEIAEVGTRFNVLAERVHDLLDAEREEVADLAHQLRTPLAALRLQIDQLPVSSERDDIAESADDLARSVDRVIVEAHERTEPGLTPTADLTAVVRDRAEFWSALADDQDRRTELHLPARAVEVALPTPALTAAIDVVLENVFSHTSDGVGYRVRVSADEHHGVVTVDDDGAGFTSNLVERGKSGTTSTGLGLDIARRAALGSGGSIAIDTNEWGGGRVESRFGRSGGASPGR